MTLTGILQDLAMIWVWLGSLFIGGAPSHTIQDPLALRASINVAQVPPPAEPLRHCTYVFEGTAASRYFVVRPHARLLVRLTSPHGTIEKASVTDAEGRYFVVLKIDAARNEPVDWAMRTDYESEEDPDTLVTGRRITMDDDRIIAVNDGRDSAPTATRMPAIRYAPSLPYVQASIG